MSSKPSQNHKKPTSNNPWDVPAMAQEGDKTPNPIYTSVGFALSAWEGLEEKLSHLFSILCESPSTAPRLAYGALLAHSARNDMLRWASEAYFSHFPKYKDECENLIRSTGKLAGRRNDIAHGICSNIEFTPTPQGYYLIPPYYNINKRGVNFIEQKYAYTSVQIMNFANYFANHENLASDLIGKMIREEFDLAQP